MITLDSRGHPHIHCINEECKRMHLVRRNKGYTGKEQQRFTCRACGTTWNASTADKAAIIEAHKQLDARAKSKQTNNNFKTDNKEPQPAGGTWRNKLFGLDD